MVQVNAGWKHSVADVIEILRDRARQMGTDALIDLTNQPIGMGIPLKGMGTIYSGHVRELWQVKVIVWESPNQYLGHRLVSHTNKRPCQKMAFVYST